MKKIILFILLNLHITIQSYLLVVQVDKNESISPLSDEIIQEHGKSILEYLLKYTWPSCITSNLTDSEMNQLFANKNGAERDFVSKKLKLLDPSLDVIFIPTTLYELFFFVDVFLECKESGEYFTKSSWKDLITTAEVLDLLDQDVNQVKNKAKSLKISPAEYVKQEINDRFKKYNDKLLNFYSKVLILHQKLIVMLLKNNALKKIDILSVDNFIQQNKEIIVNDYIQIIEDSGVDYREDFSDPIAKNTILKSIDIEYKSLQNNKALLFRGSSFFHEKNIFGKGALILATTLKDWPYSISFGNSLFAGFMKDHGSCAFIYLRKYGGYVLYIDKHEYINNYCSNLFFISPLITEVALFGRGEMFHSRSKPAVKNKEKRKIEVLGISPIIAGGHIIDHFGIFLITRDPYKQAYLFSQYFIKNAERIEKNDSYLQPEVKLAIDNFMEEQKKFKAEYKISSDDFKMFLRRYLKKKSLLNIKKEYANVESIKTNIADSRRLFNNTAKENIAKKQKATEIERVLELSRVVKLEKNRIAIFSDVKKRLDVEAEKNKIVRVLNLFVAVKDQTVLKAVRVLELNRLALLKTESIK